MRVDVDLPAMGANPLRKDIFVEVDYMEKYGPCIFGICASHTHRPKKESIAKVVQAFANAPVANPDDSTGITLHVAVSNAISEQDTLQPSGEEWDWSGFDKIKNDRGYFTPNRASIFHYAIFAHDIGGDYQIGTSGLSRNDRSSDAAFRLGASDFIVALGSGWADSVGTVNEQAGTFMHEFGHNLGLRHGGDDLHQNFEPNYLSVMNYSFQTACLIKDDQDGLFDYSRFGALPPLDEHHLNETVGLNGGSALTSYGTRYYCRPFGAWLNQRVLNANGPINWDCFLGSGGTDVEANIDDGDRDYPEPTLSTLTGLDDWAALVFDGGAIGVPRSPDAAFQPTTETTPSEELTFDVDSEFYRPYKIAFSGSGDWVTSPQITTTAPVTLTNLGALDVTVTISYTAGIGWFDLSGLPSSITLAPNASESFPITLSVPSTDSGYLSDSVTLFATIQEAPSISDSMTLNARIGPLAQFEAEPVRGYVPFEVAFTETAVGQIASRLWDFGDGDTSTETNPVHTYSTPGVYTATLTVDGPDGSDTMSRPALIVATRLTLDSLSNGIRYDGWAGAQDQQASSGGYRAASAAGQTITYRTPPTRAITLTTYLGPDQGKGQVLIDGVNKGTFDLYAAVPEYQHSVAFTGLPNRAHTVMIKVLGQKNPLSTGTEVRVDNFVVGAMTVEDDNPALKYTAWTGRANASAYGGSYRFATKKNASVYFAFNGTQFTWITARGPGYGRAQVIVDGVVKATVDLYNKTPQWQYERVIGGLTAGPHNVQIKVLGTHNRKSRGNTVVFDGYSVP